MSSVGSVGADLGAVQVSVAGGLAGASTRLLCQPLDVAKIRLQLQVERGSGRQYRGLLHLLATLPAREGVTLLWAGHLPAQLLSITYGLASFAVFEGLSSLAGEGRGGPVTIFLCGAAGGCAGTLASFPCDVVRTRLVAAPATASAAAKHLYTEGGLRAFYKGLVPAGLAVAPQAGLQFALYSCLTAALDRLVTAQHARLDRPTITVSGSLACGALAGAATKAILYPLDVVKKRLQVSGWSVMGERHSYRGMLHCLSTLVTREGLPGLYRGFTPAMVKAVATTSIHFSAYEWFCQLFLLYKR